MRIGVDSYSYHRLLGDLRPGEVAPPERLADGGNAVVREVRSIDGVDGVALQTCYLDRSRPETLPAETNGLELALSWGAPNGIEFGRNRNAVDDLFAWIEIAGALAIRTMRIVAAGPALRDRAPERREAVPSLREAAARARSLGLVLALENHGDLTARELDDLLHEVADDGLGACFDTGNALRVGDDAVAAAELLGPSIRMVHLRDVESLDTVLDPVAGPKSVPYGTGVVPLDAVLDVLEGARFEGLVCVELGQLAPDDDERDLIASCVQWLRLRLEAT
jgi:sugar phosphate isomerase/epimerase